MNDSINAQKFHNAGIDALNRGDFEKAIFEFQNVYELREKIYGKASYKLAPPLINLGIAYKNIGNIDKAIEYYKTVEDICKKDEVLNLKVLAISYTNLSVAYGATGDYNQALVYLKNAFRILKRDSVSYVRNFQDVKYNIADMQLKLGKNLEVINFSKANLKLMRSELKPRLYDLIALAYYNLSQFDLAETNYLNSINYWVDNKGVNNIELVSEYIAYSNFLLSQKRYENALLYIKKAFSISQLVDLKEKILTKSEVLLKWGDYYYLRNSEAGQIDDFRRQRKDNLLKGIQRYQESIIAMVDTFDISDPMKNPKISCSTLSATLLVEALSKKALALEKLADIFHSEFDTQTAERYYIASLNALDVVIEMIHRLQIGYENEESRLFLTQNQQQTFYEAINVSYELFSITKDKTYMLKAFEFSEKSKSSNLLASVKDVKAKEFGGIPDSMLMREKSLTSYINSYNSKLFEETHNEEPDKEKINLYSNKIFKYNEELNRLKESFEKNYPKYFSLKYENKVIDVNEVKSKLGNRQAILEYYLKSPENSSATGELYIFAISNDSIELIKETIDNEFFNRIQIFHDFLVSSDYLDTKKSDYVNYSSSAYYLYGKLIKPISGKLNGKSITIIPHDKLLYIPFDALISEQPDTTCMNFRNLQYLVKNYTINYGYSATLLFDSNRKKNSIKKLLIFSPEYNNLEARKEAETGKIYHLNALSGAKDEIKTISDYVASVSFVDRKAQETSFKENASNYDILHLAMHTIINDSLPMLSKLVFSKPGMNSTDDGYLNAYEVYNMSFKARLAVLSACETGSGKLSGGEGVMSMARGFIYAGCPAVVMTLWQVEDKSGVKIMGDFYKYLSKGKRKDEALRMAKLNHLQNSDPLTAHPHFWLGYVNIGNADALYTSNDVYFVIFLFVALLLLYADYHFRKKRFKR